MDKNIINFSQKDISAIVYLTICIPLRLYLAYLPYEIPKNKFYLLGILIFLMGILYFYLYKRFENNAIYLLHSLLYLFSLILIINKEKISGLILAVDVIISLIYWFYNLHIKSNK
ncbi:hypothetical protein N9O88_00275 [bacterium]|nr:hypothetical protein [bacterium]